MKKKILFIIPNFLEGGAEKNFIRIVNRLDLKLYDIHIVCFEKKGKNLEVLKDGINIIDLKIKRIYFAIFRISKVIRKIHPDIVFSWMGYVNAYLAFFIPVFNKKIKWLCRETSIPSLLNKSHRFPWLFNFLYKFYNNYDLIISQSKCMTSDLEKNFGIDEQKIKLINNSIDFKEINDNKDQYPVNSTTGKQNLLFVGGLRSVKRIEILFQVLALLPENYCLTIIGNGEEYQKLLTDINTANLQNRVTILTDCFNPMPYYQCSDCLLLSSQFEGFPNVVLEAFACGCPAIGFDIAGGAKEALDNYGGFYLENKTLTDFAGKIIQVCEFEKLDRNEIIQNCMEKYDIVNVIPVYNAILQS